MPAATVDAVVSLRPQSDTPEAFGYVDGSVNFRAIDHEHVVTGTNASIRRGRVWHDVPGQDPTRCVPPGCTVIRRAENGALLKIDDSEDNRGQCSECKDRCAQPDSQTIIDWRVHRVLRLHPNNHTLMQIDFQNI